MEFKGLGVLESWNRTRKPWLLKIAILFTKPGVSDLNSALLKEIPAISSRHVWTFSWMYLSSAVSLPPSKHAAPVLPNFQRNSHGFLCVCVRVLKGLPKYCDFGQLTFTGFPKFFQWGGGGGGWLRKGEELDEGWFFERGGADGWVQVLHYKSALSPKWKSAQISVYYLWKSFLKPKGFKIWGTWSRPWK